MYDPARDPRDGWSWSEGAGWLPLTPTALRQHLGEYGMDVALEATEELEHIASSDHEALAGWYRCHPMQTGGHPIDVVARREHEGRCIIHGDAVAAVERWSCVASGCEHTLAECPREECGYLAIAHDGGWVAAPEWRRLEEQAGRGW